MLAACQISLQKKNSTIKLLHTAVFYNEMIALLFQKKKKRTILHILISITSQTSFCSGSIEETSFAVCLLCVLLIGAFVQLETRAVDFWSLLCKTCHTETRSVDIIHSYLTI